MPNVAPKKTTAFKKKILCRYYPHTLLTCAAVTMTTGTALAQVAKEQQYDSPALIEEVYVTASRIRRDGMSTPTPTTMVNADELAAMAPGNLIAAVSQLPQFFDNETLNSNSTTWFARGSYGSLNLRGLGINRTLTLLNGRRMISSTAFGGVDVNQFPESMIKNVETVTGGASAAYGSDAVAGVANFILDTDFDGVSISAQSGETSRNDGGNSQYSIAFGTDVGDKAHIQMSYEKADQDAILGHQGRDWYQGWGTVRDANGILQVAPNVVSAGATYNGLIFAPGTPLQGMQFNNAGTAIEPFLRSDLTTLGPVGIPPANQSITNGGSGDDFNYINSNLMPDYERDSLFIYGDYEVTDNFKVFGQVIRSTSESWQINAPSGSFQGTPTALTIFQDNAYLPESVRQTMIDNSIESFTLRTMGGPSDLLPESYVGADTEMQSITVGFEFQPATGFFEGWNINSNYQKGKSDRIGKQSGLRVDRIFAAIDAVDNGNGEIVCRTSLYDPSAFPGCQPINLFGQGNASAEAIDYVTGFEAGQAITTPIYFADDGFDSGRTYSYTTAREKRNLTTLDQETFEISASGEIHEGWGAGPIDLAFGYSYRSEDILQLIQDVTNPPSNHSTGSGYQAVSCNDPSIGLRGVSIPDCLNTVGVQYSKVSNIKGSSTVDELFAETLVPLISDAPMVESLNLSLAARWANYSGAGPVWAWKTGLDWQINSEWRARGTFSRDARAANLSERFDATGNLTPIIDPVLDSTYNTTIVSGGNAELKPEEADTQTFGVIYEPSFLQGLSVSLDWYKVEINNSIGNLTPQGVINACSAGDQSACSRILRDANTNNIILIGDQFINIDQEVVSGTDLEIAYRTDTNWFKGDNESISARLFVSHLSERSRTTGNGEKIDRAGQTGYESSTGNNYSLPDNKITAQLTYNYGNLSAFLQGRYIASGTSENSPPPGFELSDNTVDSVFYTDLNLSYMHTFGTNTEVEFFGNITNLFDVDPPVTPYYSIFYGNPVQTNPTLFDVLGRRFTAGVKVNF